MEISLSKNNNSLQRSFVAATVVYVVTAFHHFYGAAVYNTPWRKDVGVNGGVTLLICLAFYYLYRRHNKKLYLILYGIVHFLFFGLLIGLFEGLYNHVVKNIVYFAGMKLEIFRKFFPDPPYELPEDFIFESTGILQFFVGAAAIYYLYRTFKKPNSGQQQS